LSGLNPVLERTLILSLLKFCEKGCVELETLRERGGFPRSVVDNYLKRLRDLGSATSDRNILILSPDQKLRLALEALHLGSDIQAVSKHLEWGEFEKLAASAFRANGFETVRGMRFSWNSKRWEIDVLGFSRSLLVCVDCKHWGRALTPSAMRNVVELHLKRVEALSEALPYIHTKIGIEDWKDRVVVPIIVSLHTSASKFTQGVPVVPILQLQNFITELPSYLTTMQYFKPKLKEKQLSTYSSDT